MRMVNSLSLLLGAAAMVATAAPLATAASAKVENRNGGANTTSRSNNNANRNNNNRNGNQVSNSTAYKAGQASNSRHGNTVVVAPPRGGGYNNGYHGGNNWHDDDNDFMEFVGKAAVVTAGAAIVGSVIKGEPKNSDGSQCQQSIQNGVPYVNCNGTWYQAAQPSGGQPQYQVVAPPK
jgi:hypothetical protein